jgi:hypothetical protein
MMSGLTKKSFHTKSTKGMAKLYPEFQKFKMFMWFEIIRQSNSIPSLIDLTSALNDAVFFCLVFDVVYFDGFG